MKVRTSRSGFVLILAVMLLAFVGALVAGLGVLAEVEGSGNRRHHRHVQARENARLGLTLALAELQRWTGPDQRVTATAASQPGVVHPRWTGVWDATTQEAAAATWLVSGSEFALSRPSPVTALDASTRVTMTSDTNGGGAAPLIPIRDERLGNGAPVVGHYAWWIGDEGVKAPVAAAPEAPWPVNDASHTAEQETRWFQSTARGASPPAAADEPSFEIRAEPNAGLVTDGNVLTFEQLAFLHSTDGASLGREAVERRAGSWSPNNRNVIADSREGGLRQDLSLRPDLLGAAFAAWADHDSYLEAVGSASDPGHAILPAYGSDPLRRRHRIAAPVWEGGAVFSTAPVLSFFFLQFNVRRSGGNSAPAATNAMEIRARLVVQLWNPFTSAAVPEPLRLTVAGLPDLTLIDSNGGRHTIALQERFGSPMVITLPADDVAFPGDADDHSWLPGRVYAWRAHGGAPGRWDTEFYNRTLSVANANLWVVPAAVSYLPPASNSVMLSVAGASSQLTLELQKADGTALATVRSPAYAAFTTTPQRANNNDEYRFGFMLRLVDPVDFAAAPGTSTWLTGEGSDPRALALHEPLYRTGGGGDLPSAYVGVSGNAVFTDENRLLDRVMGRSGMSYNEDTPVFELLRQPLVSVGQLQHLQIEAARPFAVGNPWSVPLRINGTPAPALFDRFFFSGLRPATTAGGGDFELLPPPLLEIARTNPATGGTTTIDDLRQQPAGRSSALLLQAGSFNVNSTDAAAWAAVLRNCRMASGEVFTFLEPSVASGTAADTSTAADGTSGANFWRFSQSAQETFRADQGYAASSTVPPAAPSVSSAANTHLYRQGRRLLSDQQVNDFAAALAAASTLRQRASGPWRGLAEFVAPEPSLGGQSALEYGIAAAGLNNGVSEFSSQWLTAADVLTSLAPVLFARSDTFRIRSYGDSTNPFTGEVVSVAWCEAVVQRRPVYFDSSEPATTLPAELSSSRNRELGRRYQIVSFRWLNRSDL
jgi:hypothetical protein